MKTFSVGSQWLHGGRVVQIDGPVSLTHINVRDVVTGAIVPVVASDLVRPPPPGQGAADPLLVPQAEWDRALQLARAFEPYHAQRSLPGTVTASIALALGISPRHVLRLRARYQPEQTTTALCRRKAGRSVGARRLDPQIEQVIAHVVSRRYARREAVSKASVVERVRLLCQRLGLSPPDRKTIATRIRDTEQFALTCQRQGRKAARQAFEARPGKLHVAHALDMVQIDHTLVDVNLVSDDGAMVIGRPWLTLAIDVATRVVLGWYLSMDAPSSDTVAMCVAHALFPKPESSADPALWPMHGKPRCILVDNGKDFRAVALRRGCEQHGIELRWRPVREPHYGAHIERLMGTFMRMTHELPGTTFSSVKQRGDYASEAKACLTLADLREWFIKKICHGYHVRTHRGLGMAPLLAWEAAFQGNDGVFAMPAVSLDPDTVRRDFYPFERRRLQRTGIQFDGSRYWHETLMLMVERVREVVVHYDRRDRSRIWVRGEDGLLIEASAVAGRALNEAITARLTGEDKARLDARLLAGHEACDAIQDRAEGRRRAGKKALSHTAVAGSERGRRGGLRKARGQGGDILAERAVPLNRDRVTVEVLEP